MILESLTISTGEFERRTGWAVKPEGLCKGDVCLPFPAGDGERLDARVPADRLKMPLVHDEEHNLWCLGPEAGGRALTTVEAPDFKLPDIDGKPFRLRSLRGRKVLLVAWASW